MSRPSLYLYRMIAFLLTIGVAVAFVFAPLRDAFLANAPLNGLILGVLALGIINNFRQVMTLDPEVAWIEQFRSNMAPTSQESQPRLLASMATLLGERKGNFSLSTMSMRSMLDGIASRLDESRDMSRYIIGLLIFLGLLGTFWGLLETVSSIRGVIGGLSVSGGDMTAVFKDLKSGLEAPLSGMGTAFSSSLFGLAGSLVLGFLDVQGGHAQNRFYNELEEWLASLTRLSSGALPGDGEQAVPAYVQALLEQTAESLENLQRTLSRGEESRIATSGELSSVSERLGTLTDHMRTEQALMMKLAENQSDLKPILIKMSEGNTSNGGIDDATRTHIRNLEAYVARIMEDQQTGRDDVIQQLRSEIKLLARTIAATDSGKG